MREIPALATTFVAGVEACRLTAYRDSAGVWTIGYGHTGPEVHEGLVWTQAQCLAALAADLRIAATRLAGVLSAATIETLSDHQYAALISFVFNLGADKTWTIWKLLNAGKRDHTVTDQLKRFDKARVRGVLTTIPGLDHRRLAEVTLWDAADVPAAVAVALAAPIVPPPSSETRVADTPPTPPATKPLAQSKSFIGGVATAVATTAVAATPAIQTAASGVRQVSDAISPYATASHHIAQVAEWLAVAAAALAVITVGLMALKHSKAAA